MTLSLVNIVNSLLVFYSWLIIAYALMSWLPASGAIGEIRRVIGTIVEPYVGLFRRFLPMASLGGGGIDFSPLVAYLVLLIARRFIVMLLLRLGL